MSRPFQLRRRRHSPSTAVRPAPRPRPPAAAELETRGRSFPSCNGVRLLLACACAASALQPAGAQVRYSDWFPGTSSISEPEIIPPAFRGRWASNRAACDDPEAATAIHIMPDGVDGWGYGARLVRVTQTGRERSIRLKLAYEGEGEFRDAVEVWTLDERGQRLSTVEGDDPPAYRLMRCR